ncbi:MSC_0624 family F1-like ATPase-associated membrane protein [Mycoplasma zalophidermidis]
MNSKQKNNLSIKIYLSILGIWFFCSLLFILIFSNQTIMSAKLYQNNSSSLEIIRFFNFSTLETREYNFTLLFRISILLFLLIYPITKSFRDILINKEKINNYWPWFSLYFILSISSFILFFTYHSFEAIEIAKVLWVFIPLYFIDLSFSLYSYNVKKKSDPITYGNSSILIISQVFKALLVSFILTIFFTWTAKSVNPDSPSSAKLMLIANDFSDWFKQLFTEKKAINLLIIISLFSGVAILVFFSNWDKINLFLNKQYDSAFTRNSIYFLLISVLAILTWTTSVFFVINNKRSFVIPDKIYISNYWYLSFSVISLLILAFYLISSFVKPFKTKSLIKNTISISGFSTLNWVSFFILTMANNDNRINLINLFITSIVSIIMMIIYLKRNISATKISLSFIYLQLAFLGVLIFIFDLNQILISKDNFGFNYINSDLSLTQILTITELCIAIAYSLYSVTNLWFTLYKLSIHKKNITKEVNNEK